MNTRMRWLLVLLAITSVATAVFIALAIYQSRSSRGPARGAAGQGAIMQGSGAAGDLPVLFPAPAFNLTERSGEAFGSEQLRGKVWVVNFIFKQCTGACPMMTSSMAQLQIALKPLPAWQDIRLVSITVDPENDTPAELRQYAQWADADPTHWLFLTGDKAAIRTLITEGFHVTVSDSPANEGEPIIHSQRFMLVDQQGQVRGLYDGQDTTARAKLQADLLRLVATPGAATQE